MDGVNTVEAKLVEFSELIPHSSPIYIVHAYEKLVVYANLRGAYL